ncbi:MAG: maleylpyruvate isomerase family mycothiol-dependent enzyme [Acidimicrobiales bacterium]|nr:maleylpyruvate isomerase family mycothiol-dependent enzyme [Acidimicrobiales bacterium]
MDTFTLIAVERRRLADELDTLSEADWAASSLCDGWTAHVVAAHLNLPWASSTPKLLLGVLRHRGDLNKAMDSASQQLAGRLSPERCVRELRAHAESRFVPPTMPPEAPLSDVVLHGADILRPLGRSVAVDPEAMLRVLGFLVSDKAKRSFRSASIDGVRLEATDLDWAWDPPGASATASGPAPSLAGLLVGRPAYGPDVSGDGVARLLARG